LDQIFIVLDHNRLHGAILHTEYDHESFECYVHPINGQQECLDAEINGRIVQVQCLMFCNIYKELEKIIHTELYDVSKPGNYAIVQFPEYNISGKFEKEF